MAVLVDLASFGHSGLLALQPLAAPLLDIPCGTSGHELKSPPLADAHVTRHADVTTWQLTAPLCRREVREEVGRLQ